MSSSPTPLLKSFQLTLPRPPHGADLDESGTMLGAWINAHFVPFVFPVGGYPLDFNE